MLSRRTFEPTTALSPSVVLLEVLTLGKHERSNAALLDLFRYWPRPTRESDLNLVAPRAERTRYALRGCQLDNIVPPAAAVPDVSARAVNRRAIGVSKYGER